MGRKMKVNRFVKRGKFIAHLVRCAVDLAFEYINEAEHQDGEAYWDQFDTELDVQADFGLYLNNREKVNRKHEEQSEDGGE